MELHTISIDLGKTVFHPITRLPGLRHFADRLLGSWTVNFCSSITRARTLSANWSARACSLARELRANADTHF